jgi:hypothetical protein
VTPAERVIPIALAAPPADPPPEADTAPPDLLDRILTRLAADRDPKVATWAAKLLGGEAAGEGPADVDPNSPGI